MKKETETAVQKLEREYREKLARAQTEDTVRGLVGSTNPRFIHISDKPLYGRVGIIKYGDEFAHDSIVKYEDLPTLVRTLPPVGLTMVSHGGLSFMPTEYVETVSEKERETFSEETEVCPLFFSAKPSVTIEWVTKVGDFLLEIECAMGSSWTSQNIVSYEVERVDFHGGYEYKVPRVTPRLIDILSPDGHLAAQAQTPILWASGSDQYPSRATVYWMRVGYYNPEQVGLWQADAMAAATRGSGSKHYVPAVAPKK